MMNYDDGTRQFFYPTGSAIFIPGTHTAAGVPTGAGGDNDDPGTGSGPGSVGSPVDDYPWPTADPDGMSPLRYSYRDCTDFAAWRINRDTGCTHSPWKWTWGQLRITNGNAIGWKPDWITHGWGVSDTPQPGMIGWYGSKAGAYGHVNYVQAVKADGTVHLEEYNWSPNHQAYNQRDAAPGSAYYPDSFLAMPPH